MMILYVVSRQRPALYNLLREEFAGDEDVAIRYDRRTTERRRRVLPAPEVERRQNSRRQPGDADDHFRSLGWIILDVERVLSD